MTKVPGQAPAPQPGRDVHPRWTLLHDVLMLQVKLFFAAWQHFILGPVTLVAAFLDLVWRGPHGSRFYRVLEWGQRSEEALGVYSALRPGRKVRDEAGARAPDSTPSNVAFELPATD